HILREDPSCPCGKTFRTKIHTITDCPQYENYCTILTEKLPDILPKLLSTKEGSAVVIKILGESGAFRTT
ncbi:hypothetical protein FPV67DRAFT_1386297, partial [Lyophyllum atratum]